MYCVVDIFSMEESFDDDFVIPVFQVPAETESPTDRPDPTDPPKLTDDGKKSIPLWAAFLLMILLFVLGYCTATCMEKRKRDREMHGSSSFDDDETDSRLLT